MSGKTKRKQVGRGGRGSIAGRPAAKKTKRRGQAGGAKRPKVAAGRVKKGVKRTSPRRAVFGKGRGDLCGVRLELIERAGSVSDEESNSYEYHGAGTKHVGGRKGRIPQVAERTCLALAAVGHVQRAALLRKLLEGPATYRALQKVTKLKPGPLYHHITQLRLAGLILPKQRDLYELTRGGRNLILAVIVMGPMVGDTRRRPIRVGG